jgi:hypothetical protein
MEYQERQESQDNDGNEELGGSGGGEESVTQSLESKVNPAISRSRVVHAYDHENGFLRVKSADDLFDGKYRRDAEDLIINLPNDSEILVLKYFQTGMLPILVSETERVLVPQLVEALVANNKSSAITPEIGKISSDGVFYIKRVGGEQFSLYSANVNLFAGDAIKTGKVEGCIIRLLDGTRITFAPDTLAIICSYQSGGDNAQANLSMGLLKGAMEIVTAEVSLSSIESGTQDNVEVFTPSARVVIRGITKGRAEIGEDGEIRFGIGRNQDGTSGWMDIINNAGQRSLYQQNAAITVDNFFSLPQQQTNIYNAPSFFAEHKDFKLSDFQISKAAINAESKRIDNPPAPTLPTVLLEESSEIISENVGSSKSLGLPPIDELMNDEAFETSSFETSTLANPTASNKEPKLNIGDSDELVLVTASLNDTPSLNFADNQPDEASMIPANDSVSDDVISDSSAASEAVVEPDEEATLFIGEIPESIVAAPANDEPANDQPAQETTNNEIPTDEVDDSEEEEAPIPTQVSTQILPQTAPGVDITPLPAPETLLSTYNQINQQNHKDNDMNNEKVIDLKGFDVTSLSFQKGGSSDEDLHIVMPNGSSSSQNTIVLKRFFGKSDQSYKIVLGED